MFSGAASWPVPSGCAISGIMDRSGSPVPGERILRSISSMRDRSNGLGGGFAAYGIYPKYADYNAFHIMFENETARKTVEDFLQENFFVAHGEEVPTTEIPEIRQPPLLWRYFVEVKPEKVMRLHGERKSDYLVRKVMELNRTVSGAYVSSSGRNLGVFKGVGFPEDIGRFYRIEEYEAYLWTAHGRFPTNTPGWWGGAHPFSILETAVVHNGEITSYGINKRYLESFGYEMLLFTDTEVCAYLYDLLTRKHKLPEWAAFLAMSSDFWRKIDASEEEKRRLHTLVRQTYGPAMLNGPFSLILSTGLRMIGFNDRIKLRPMTCAVVDDLFYMASEEAAIRAVEADVDKIWVATAGAAVMAELYPGVEIPGLGGEDE